MSNANEAYYSHESSFVDDGAQVGPGTKIWHFCHIMSGAKVGADCSLGQGVMIAANVSIGDNCRLQNNVSIYEGVTLEDGVFCGPSCVFTNVATPRAEYSRRGEYSKTLIRRGATIGANATIVCGVELGAYCFIAAGAVITKNIPAHAVMAGVPATQIGWAAHSGEMLRDDMACPRTGDKYIVEGGRLIRIEKGDGAL